MDSQPTKPVFARAHQTIALLAFLFGILAGSLGAYSLWRDSMVRPTGINQNEDTSLTQEEWVEYRNEEARLKFNYPKGWVHAVDQTLFVDGTKNLGEVSGYLTSPHGKKLEWQYVVWGGKGGDCEFERNEVAFTEGNTCSSKHIYSAESLELSPQPESHLLDGNKKGLVLSKTKYQSNNSKNPTYQICLDDYYLLESRAWIGTRMGLMFECDFWSTGFNVKFEVNNKDDFNSEEAQIAEKIMRSFTTF